MKYWRRYVLAATAVMSVTVVAAGVAAVDECARRISLGEAQSVIAWDSGAQVREPANVFLVKN